LDHDHHRVLEVHAYADRILILPRQQSLAVSRIAQRSMRRRRRQNNNSSCRRAAYPRNSGTCLIAAQNDFIVEWNFIEGPRFNRRLSAEATMNGLIYLIGLIVVIMFILSFLGLR
jgi:hypothetical protein